MEEMEKEEEILNQAPIQKLEVEEELLNEGFSQNNGASLQDNFKKFRDQKMKERQILKLARNGEFSGDGQRTDAYKDSLRMKFIEAAKKYIGIPYAERFKADEMPVAPLYLDCCALVRRAVTDLQEDFGIILGKWNQAYQMDTLPIILQQNELKPGDLIFYEGLYSSKRSKSQKHNNVHVEIFLGGETGEATIGSRYHKGCVSIYPSFKFTSTSWSLVQYHFRSLDTWLNGECRSHCIEHPWHSDMLGIEAAAGKRSIFSTDTDDESAGGNEEDDEIDNEDDNVVSCVSSTDTNAEMNEEKLPLKSIGNLKPLDPESKSDLIKLSALEIDGADAENIPKISNTISGHKKYSKIPPSETPVVPLSSSSRTKSMRNGEPSSKTIDKSKSNESIKLNKSPSRFRPKSAEIVGVEGIYIYMYIYICIFNIYTYVYIYIYISICI
jgi:hypothetical protein